MALMLKQQPDWHAAAQTLVSGCSALPSSEERIRLMERVCKHLGDNLYPAFLQILCQIGDNGDERAKQLITGTLVHALVSGRLPSGKLSAWGAGTLSSNSAFGQTRSLGPLEYLCSWYAQPTGRSPLTQSSFQKAASCILNLIATNEEARSLYCIKLLADIQDPLSGSLSRRTRLAMEALVTTWEKNASTKTVINSYLNALQDDGLSRLANLQPSFSRR
ncbi:hypothetical protein [Thiolapillus sp.]